MLMIILSVSVVIVIAGILIYKGFAKNRIMDNGNIENPFLKEENPEATSQKDYVPRSYFEGAVPENNYIPSEPYTATVKTGAHSYEQDGYVKLFITSGGADSPRPITLRSKGDKWYLWEYSSVLLGIKAPAEADPWA